MSCRLTDTKSLYHTGAVNASVGSSKVCMDIIFERVIPLVVKNVDHLQHENLMILKSIVHFVKNGFLFQILRMNQIAVVRAKNTDVVLYVMLLVAITLQKQNTSVSWIDRITNVLSVDVNDRLHKLTTIIYAVLKHALVESVLEEFYV